jgi:rod shape-determining protein MreD
VSYYIGVPLLLLVALIETSVLPAFRVFGVQPNLTLLLLVCWATVRPRQEIYYLVPVAGIFLGLVESAPMGLALIALAPVALIPELRDLQIGEGRLLITVAFTVLMTLLYDLVYLTVHTVNGEAGALTTAFLDVTMPSLVLNVVLVIPIYALVALLSQDVRRSVFV